MPVIDLIAAQTQEVADHVLARSFGAAGRWDRDKILRGRKLRIESGIDRIQNSLTGIADIHRVVVSFDLPRPPSRSKHILPDLAEAGSL
jgi:hypothetical protein